MPRKPILPEPGKESLDKLVRAGCDRDTVVRWLGVLAHPVQVGADWYHLDGFPPDKLKRYPEQLDKHATEIEAFNNAIARNEMYRGLLTLMSKHPILASLGPNWFENAFKNLPEQLRQYGAVISLVKFAMQHFAPKAALLGRARIGNVEGFMFYIRAATGRMYYEDVANMLSEVCPDGNHSGEPIDAAALRKRFGRSEYRKMIKQLKVTASQFSIPRP